MAAGLASYKWMFRSLRAVFPKLALLVLFGARCGGDPLSGVRKDVFECEEAVQHAESCCGKRVTVGCIHSTGCESGHTVVPQIPVTSAFMLRTTSCAELVTSGFCADPQGNLDSTHQDLGSSPAGSADLAAAVSSDLGADMRGDMSVDLR